MSSIITRTIFCTTLILICSHYSAIANLQTLLIRTVESDEDDSAGVVETYQTSVRDLKSKSEIIKHGNMKSFCIVGVGLWMTALELENVEGRVYTSGWNIDPNRRLCTSIYPTNTKDYFQLSSIRHGANSNLSLSAISLYTEPTFSFGGVGGELYFYGSELSLPESVLFKSFAYTGQDNWTVFSETNFGGTSQCLVPELPESGNEPEYHYVAILKNIEIQVGSVRRGCTAGKMFQNTNRNRENKNMGMRVFSEDFNVENLEIRETSRIGPIPSEMAESFQPALEKLEDEATLNLYTQEGRKLSTDGLELRLLEPISVSWYNFTLNGNWLVFESTDFEGTSYCLKYGSSMPNPDIPNPLVVGAIRKGCHGVPEVTTTTMSTTTSLATVSSLCTTWISLSVFLVFLNM